jgi:hypothetical protein
MRRCLSSWNYSKVTLMPRKPVAATQVFASLDGFVPDAGSVYVYGTTPEERSAHSASWEARGVDVKFVRLAAHTRWQATFATSPQQIDVQLRSETSVGDFWRAQNASTAYIDITGLGHHVWAPLLRSAIGVVPDVRVVYVEPIDYSRSAAPTEGEIFDLSEKIGGIAPIPGFASFYAGPDDPFHLVALLGFEGPRFAYLLENVQPHGDAITPVIGAPGFRSEYPFYAYHGNKAPLLTSRAWTAVRYVTANCPFSVVGELEYIANRVRVPLKVATIGTKPHSLGAVLYAMAERHPVEIVYDHPIRTAKRTVGASRALVYRVSGLMAELTS